jgi:L-histidine N-alpha-methyltransferase
MWVFLGSTIGNFVRSERVGMLARFATAMSSGDSLLIGVDLVKEESRLVAAYNDSMGVTADFNLNVLNVLNKEMGADFDLNMFAHRALWNRDESRIEMRLRSLQDQKVSLVGIDLQVSLAEGEEILTEISTKFTPGGFAQELIEAGFEVEHRWFDEAADFLVLLARPQGPRARA